MQTYSVSSLSEARSIIRHYRLDQLDWEDSGTANGFANYLFLLGAQVSVEMIAHELQCYKAEFRRSAAKGRNLDVQFSADAESLAGGFEDCMKRRGRLAACVHEIKYGIDGPMLWNGIARLATTLQPAEELGAWAKPTLVPRMKEVLLRLREFEDDFHDSLAALQYIAGLDPHLDFLIRQGVERLDDMLLRAEPWSARDPDWFTEVGALLKLAKDEGVQGAMDAVLKASKGREASKQGRRHRARSRTRPEASRP